ncbi:MAG TPA: MBL fold metallo-hydrolase [Mariprofundaceae bacterium]|nr:MBL fold metallo-hydrolase [Mariprofundaceae bacterium]
MLLRQLFDEATWTYTYILADEDSHEAIIIDSVVEKVERDLLLINELGLTLKYAVDTHVHADHITGAGLLRERTGCQTGVAASEGVACADMALKEGDSLQFGEYALQVLETPGHTSGCLSFVCEDKVFTGDALFIRGCGRTDFQAGDADTLYASITEKLFTLSDETIVYPGHDYKGMMLSTIAEEKEHNPRVKLGREGFVDLMNNLNLAMPKRIHEAVPANMACGVKDK